MKHDAETYLRAIEAMLARIDERLPDESMAPKPYEMSATEMRDVLRMARGERPRTKAGRAAWKEAVR
jgi:hypothetical protein